MNTFLKKIICSLLFIFVLPNLTFASDFINSDIYLSHVKEFRSKKVIYIDAGHGYNSKKYGSIGPYGSTTTGAVGEADYTYELSLELSDALKKEGYIVKNIEDLSLNNVTGDRELFGNSGRRKLFIENQCDMMIQLHYNYNDNKELSGGHIIYSSNSYDSQTLADLIINQLECNHFRLNEKHAKTHYISKRDELSLFSGPFIEKPIILIECGFGSPGAPDEEYLREDETKQILIQSIIDGIHSYYGLSGIISKP